MPATHKESSSCHSIPIPPPQRFIPLYDVTVKVQVVRLHPDARLPQRQTKGAACFDLFTVEDITIPAAAYDTRSHLIRTGLAVAIPEGYHMKVFLRSSVGLHSRLRLANQTGIIDSDYRGEVFLILENFSPQPFHIPAGTRIAQCLIERNIPVIFEEIDELEMTERATGGFGSTGNT